MGHTTEHNHTAAAAMKGLVILSVFLGSALAAPQIFDQQFEQNPNGRFTVLRSESNGPVEADFSWLFETENGINANANGLLAPTDSPTMMEHSPSPMMTAL